MRTRSTLPTTERARYCRNPRTGYFEKRAFPLPPKGFPTLPDALRLEDAYSGHISGNARHVLTIIRNPSEPLALGRPPILSGLRPIVPEYPLLTYGNRLNVPGTGTALSDIVALLSPTGRRW